MAFHDRPYYGSDRYGGGQPRIRIPTPRRGSVTMWLIIANIAVLILDAMFMRIQHGQPPYPPEVHSWLVNWGDFSFPDAIQRVQAWRLFSYQYLHGDFGHLFGNMLVLFFFGPWVEDYLGSRRFFAFWTIAGIGGALLYLILLGLGNVVPNADHIPGLLLYPMEVPLIGASACVFGVLAACLRIAPDRTILLFFILPMKVKVLVWLVLIYEFYSVMFTGVDGGGAAHLGGAILGAILIRKTGWLNFSERVSLQGVREGAARRSNERATKRQQVIDGEIDRILKKVSEQGLQSLTEKEKRTLKQATEQRRNVG